MLRMNSKKFVFGVSSGKLLGFMVSNRGIEVDPSKVKAILEMPPPKNLKELRGLIGYSSLEDSFHSTRKDVSRSTNC